MRDMRCLFCGKPTTEKCGEYHVFSHALAKNRVVLPRGAVCDGCNHYIGRRLDTNLVRYPLIAFAIQFLGTTGKSGKPRRTIGGVPREAQTETFKLKLMLGNPEPLATPDGKRRYRSQLKAEPQFQFLRFRRALHCMALGAVACVDGVEKARETRYDAVRSYIRCPTPSSLAWPYAQVEQKGKSIPRVLCAERVGEVAGQVIVLQLFQVVYAVDLLNSGSIDMWAMKNDARLVPPEDSAPPPVTVTFGDK